MKPWWEKWPGRLEHELDLLMQAGIPFEQDQDAFKRDIIALHLRPEVNGKEIKLEAIFPDVYPYMRFEVFAPDLSLNHHQNPFGKNLCFIGRSTLNWETTDTLADFIVNRLPLVISAGSSEDSSVVSAIEEHQGEPLTDYYPGLDNSIVLIDSSWELDATVGEGKFIAGINIDKYSFKGAIYEIHSTNNELLIESEPVIKNLYSKHITGRWIRVHEPILLAEPSQMLKKISQQTSKVTSPIWHDTPIGKVDIFGIVFPEEISYRHKKDGWIFILRIGKEITRKVRKKKQYGLNISHSFVNSGRAGKIDLSQRIPELSGLQEKKVAVIGLGCLGAPSVLEYAKCGIGELRILDYDRIEAGTTVRWPLGLSSAGDRKTEALSRIIERNYPYTKILKFQHRIGEVSRNEKQNNDLTVLNDLLNGVDLLYDASAERGLQNLLSNFAVEYGIPYIGISTTPGSWGGCLVRIMPNKTEGCWMCFMKSLEDGLIPTPNYDPKGDVQPLGCAAPTFTGNSFDSNVISTGGIRLAIATLLLNSEKSYPSFDWDVAIINLRDQEGNLIPPEWKTYHLKKHSSCHCNNN